VSEQNADAVESAFGSALEGVDRLIQHVEAGHAPQTTGVR
jgi:hypothetical protein